ncbi:hypothetical protein HYDPIDRAFT_64863, partial [Hydnomerulius pinastri MD-312]
KQTRLNYTNFESSIKVKHAIDKKGWPNGIPFTSPYNISNVEQVRVLRDALKRGNCFFYKMTPREYREFEKELEARRDRGETISAPRKKRSDAGKSRKRKQVNG